MLILLSLLMAGCHANYPPKLLVEGHPPRMFERVEGNTHFNQQRGWYDASQLDQIVRIYVEDNDVDFDFRGTEPQFWIGREREYLARSSYSSGFGKPVLSIDIGWDGYVVNHDLTIAVEGPIGDASDGP